MLGPDTRRIYTSLSHPLRITEQLLRTQYPLAMPPQRRASKRWLVHTHVSLAVNIINKQRLHLCFTPNNRVKYVLPVHTAVMFSHDRTGNNNTRPCRIRPAHIAVGEIIYWRYKISKELVAKKYRTRVRIRFEYNGWSLYNWELLLLPNHWSTISILSRLRRNEWIDFGQKIDRMP